LTFATGPYFKIIPAYGKIVMGGSGKIIKCSNLERR
jgi:hypothetical protein